MLNDDEIVTSVQEESDPVNDETDEDEDNSSNESSMGPSNADAFSALATIRKLPCSTTAAQENQRPCSEKTKVYNGTAKNEVSGFMYCMARIRLSERYPIPIDSDQRRSTVLQFFNQILV
ncbi:hypothetical protein TNCV_5064142 [Trichonephila clavipes]|nr:hypothetical protein TNCV_5064142 [Trichonephila clavipes]